MGYHTEKTRVPSTTPGPEPGRLVPERQGLRPRDSRSHDARLEETFETSGVDPRENNGGAGVGQRGG